MEVPDYIDYVESEGKGFAAAVDAGDLDVEIPPCDGWNMRDLVRHLGMIHLWAAANVAFPSDDVLDTDDLPDLVQFWPELANGGEYPADADLVAWYRDTLANLVEVLRSTPTDHQCASFLPAPTPLTMWSRRQASEIACHRFDAEVVRGIATDYDPEFAADILDELLSGFAPGPVKRDVDSARTIDVHATDVDEHWYVTITPDGIITTREGSGADLTARGTAAELYLLFWNRTPPASVDLAGDTDLMDFWLNNCRIRWG